MGWKQWSAVVVVIGGGILLQIPGHDDTEMRHGDIPADMAVAAGVFRTVALDVTGMT